MNRNKIDM